MMRAEALPVPDGIPVRLTDMVADLVSGKHLRTREGCVGGGGVSDKLGGGKEGPATLLIKRGGRRWSDIGATARWRSRA
jgi:hypothetical protein